MSDEERLPVPVTLVFGLVSAADDLMAGRPHQDMVSALAAELVDCRPGASLLTREALVDAAVHAVAEAAPEVSAMVSAAGIFVMGWLRDRPEVTAGG